LVAVLGRPPIASAPGGQHGVRPLAASTAFAPWRPARRLPLAPSAAFAPWWPAPRPPP